MFVQAISAVNKAMFPIFRIDTLPAQNQTTICVKGTGFFIDSTGTFISVAHIFDNPTAQTQFGFCGFLPEHVVNPFELVQELARDDQNDIFIGKIDINTPEFLTLSEEAPAIGKTVCISGYPLPNISVNAQGGFDLSGVRRYFQPSFVLDKAIVSCDNGQGIQRTHNGFLVRDFGLFGMSGGPVFDLEGILVGMQASVTSPRVSTNGKRSITVENAQAINAVLIREVLDTKNIPFG